jgi:pyruvate dehydrogenase E2 component (dihydrolipoamide acetyltransferase)
VALSVVMPALEMAQETGKVVSWLKKEGETVVKGEMLLEIETDKAVVEIEALGDGILSAITAREGDVVPVGQTIAWLLAAGESVPAAEQKPAQTGRRMDTDSRSVRLPPPHEASADRHSLGGGGQADDPVRLKPDATGGSLKLSPKARRLAAEHGVDPASVRGTGPGGEILADDILAAAKSSGTSGTSGTPGTLSTVARLMAERTTQSWTTVPHFFVVRDVDATKLVSLREKLAPGVQQSHGVKLTQTDLLVALVARVLRTHASMNASWTGNGIRTNSDINVGLAIATADGVVAPVVQRADGARLGDIATRRHDLAERARAGRLQAADLNGGTFTISNLGMLGVDAFTAIIVAPQAAILAVGAIADRVVAANGQVVIRPMVTLTLSSDHRVVDGARAAQFMKDLTDALQDPEPHLG